MDTILRDNINMEINAEKVGRLFINFITWITYEGMVYENVLFSHIF